MIVIERSHDRAACRSPLVRLVMEVPISISVSAYPLQMAAPAGALQLRQQRVQPIEGSHRIASSQIRIDSSASTCMK